MTGYELIYEPKQETVRVKYSFDTLSVDYSLYSQTQSRGLVLNMRGNPAQMRAAGRATVEASIKTLKRNAEAESKDWIFKEEKAFNHVDGSVLMGMVAQHGLTHEKLLVVKHPVVLKAGNPYKLAFTQVEGKWALKDDDFANNLLPRQFEELDADGHPVHTVGHTVITMRPHWKREAGQLKFKGMHEPKLAMSDSVANDWRFWHSQVRDYKVTTDRWNFINPAERMSKDAIIVYLAAGYSLLDGANDEQQFSELADIFEGFQLAQMNDLRGIEYQPESELVA